MQYETRETAAQNGSIEKQEGLLIKTKTELMQLRTVVLDRSGHVVENLKKEDFELYEDEKPQEISFFNISRLDDNQKKQGSVENEPRLGHVTQKEQSQTPDRSTLLFVDTLHLSISSLNRVKEALRHFTSVRMTDRDMAAIATSGQTLGIAQQFTQDKKLLNYAIEQIRLGPIGSEKAFTPLLAAGVLANQVDDYRLAIDLIRGEQNLRDCCMLRTLARNRALQVLSEQSFYRKSTVSAIRDFSEQMINLPGKKMIIIFSDGFTLYDNDSGTHSDQLRPIIDLAVKSGVAVYAIDAKGLQIPPTVDAGKNRSSSTPDSVETNCNGTTEPRCEAPDPGQINRIMSLSEREELNGLSQIAQETGGKLFGATNNIDRLVDEALDANRYYYVLAYYLQANDNGQKFRKIRLRVRNHPEYAVQTARGFYPSALKSKSESEAVISPHQRLINSINAGYSLNQLNVSATSEFMTNQSDDKNVTLTIDFEGYKSTQTEQRQTANIGFEIISYIYDAESKQVEAISATVNGKLTPERVSQAENNGYRFSRRLLLKPGVYQARIGIREEGTDKFGTATAWVDVREPENQKFDMSSIILRNPLNKNSELGEDDKRDLEQIKIAQGIPLYGRDIFCEYSFRIHPGKTTSQDAEIVFMRELLKGGKAVKAEPWLAIFEDETKVDSKGWFEVHDDMDLSSLDPGIYELRVTVKESRSNQIVQRNAVFGVE